MRSGREFGLVVAALLLLLIVVARIGSEQNREPSTDPRRSIYLTGPSGAQGFAGALERVGVQVVPLRQRLPRVERSESGTDSTVVAVLGPTFGLDPADAMVLAALAEGGTDLLLAGSESEAAIRCFGYTVRPRLRPESAASVEPSGPSYTFDVLGVLREISPTDSLGCKPTFAVRADTLLRTGRGHPVAIRLGLESGASVTLVADDELFTNRVLRSTAGAPFVLRLVAGRYRRMLVDEYDHGFGPSGRLDQAVIAWVKQTPWGWAGLQLAVVGLLAVIVSGVRFGPVLHAIERRRRSPLEHVQALATALAAARGHAVAVRLLVQGLQRRLARGGPMAGGERGDPAAWLAATAPRLRTPGGRQAADALLGLMRRPVSTANVVEAAELVETIWSDLTSASRPAMSSNRPA
ncbi:MAG TPA: DUF4350 domain-containing protein [Gemmatimonadales bacterium]|nr:DUF4350 domain-containing protein [Gemmatimonadales bacterium]